MQLIADGWQHVNAKWVFGLRTVGKMYELQIDQ